VLYPKGMIDGSPLGRVNRPGHPLHGHTVRAFKQWESGRIQCLLPPTAMRAAGYRPGKDGLQFFPLGEGEFVPDSPPPPPLAPVAIESLGGVPGTLWMRGRPLHGQPANRAGRLPGGRVEVVLVLEAEVFAGYVRGQRLPVDPREFVEG